MPMSGYQEILDQNIEYIITEENLYNQFLLCGYKAMCMFQPLIRNL
jgi:hypothetical protein